MVGPTYVVADGRSSSCEPIPVISRALMIPVTTSVVPRPTLNTRSSVVRVEPTLMVSATRSSSPISPLTDRSPVTFKFWNMVVIPVLLPVPI